MVSLPKLSVSLARFITAGDKPSEPPITKVISECPYVPRSAISLAKTSEGRCLPSMAKAITHSLSLILCKIRSPSLAFTSAISASERFSGAFSSATSTILTFANLSIRFKYSAIPSRKYFSFSLPTPMILMFIQLSPLSRHSSTGNLSFSSIPDVLRRLPIVIVRFLAQNIQVEVFSNEVN